MYGKEKRVNMGTSIRPELSKDNKYWIERHRYYELNHFCLQYPIWKKSYLSWDGLSKRPTDATAPSNPSRVGNPTVKCAEAKLFYSTRIEMVERIARETDPDLAQYILKGVTEGVSYSFLKARLGIPCCRDTYYDLYRRFFWLLSRARN